MMKFCVLAILLLCSPLIASSQNQATDSLQHELALAKHDSSRVLILADLALFYLSEVSTELVDELEEEIRAGHAEDALDITGDLRETPEKVNHHGKCADIIVKSMLQHSRASSGQKEPTDLNALTDEYLRLAYQNLRAKDQTFTAGLRLNLDAGLGKVHIAPQEIGRGLLNLYNNAFYVVQDRQKQEHNGYMPQIEVTTYGDNGKVAVRIKDNGTCIPADILDKIYQPFFTTKPTGQGTGLGLSLSYANVTKGHGGEISVESVPSRRRRISVQYILAGSRLATQQRLSLLAHNQNSKEYLLLHKFTLQSLLYNPYSL
ncbi:hypothetical protein GCM10023187_03550 [Nibrella viscosa]|uniref:histidine kinase n=1 Tax=Nibrella viscosa TaxID=1084524 RepID=A0ABP8JTV7_9BACT